MSTQPIVVSTAWAKIATGQTVVSVQLEKGSPDVYLAVSSTPPAFNTGHPAKRDLILNFGLDAGEDLYAICLKGNGCLIVTE